MQATGGDAALTTAEPAGAKAQAEAFAPDHVCGAQAAGALAPPAHAKPAAQGAQASAAPTPPFDTKPGAQSHDSAPCAP